MKLITHHSSLIPHPSSLFLALILSIGANGQTGIEKKTIATLGPGETLAYSESCFRLDLPSETFSFVTVTGSGDSKQYYCYGADGKKTGPVSKPDPSYWADNQDIKEDKCNAADPGHMARMSEMIDFSDGSVNFQGKKYGPYGQAILFNQPANESGFCAVAISADMKLTAFDNSGRKIRINGMPEESNNPKVFLFTMDGKKFGPYGSDSFRDTWYTDAGQWIVYAGSEVFLNGTLLFKVDEYVAACDIWITADGRQFGWANYEKLEFSDGTSYTAPIVITRTEENGKSLLKWLTLEDGKNLVFYQRPF
jgi:hypothetical protein